MASKNLGMPRDLLVIAVLLNFATWAPLFSIPPLETILAKDLGVTNFQASLLFSGPIMMLALMAIPAGLIADRIGIKKAVGIGGILVFAGTLFEGIAGGYNGLILASLILGLGIGWTFSSLPKLVRAYSLPRQTFQIMGILNGAGLVPGIALATTISVPWLYPVTQSYRGVFFIWSIPIMLTTVLWWILMREPRLIVQESPAGKTTLTIKKLFANKTLRLLASLLFLHNYFFYSWAGWIPAFLIQKGFSPATAGLIASVMVWVTIPTALLVPIIFARTRVQRRLFIWVPSLVFTCLAAGILYTAPFSLWFFMAVAGIANILRFNVLLILPVEVVPPEQFGAASGVVLAVGYLGAVIGPVVAGYILDVTLGFQITFIILSAMSLLTLGLAFLVPANLRQPN